MKSTFLIIALMIFSSSYAQIAGKKSKDSYMLFDSVQVNVGDTIYLANGTDRKGDFVSIYQPPNYLLGVEESSLQRKFSGKYFKIKHFKVEKNKRTGEKTVAVVSFGGLNYIADLELGISSKEIKTINSRSFEEKKEVQNIVVNNSSLADELAKLKKLQDEGVLTKEEFDAQKKKLLEKN